MDLDQIKEEAQKKGEKLGFLIASLNLPNEARESLLTVLPEMSEEQIDRLMVILEAAYLNQKTGNLDQDLSAKLTTIEAGFNKDMQKADKDALKELSQLEKDLDAKKPE
ncbi:MAG: hypothetical protein WC526_02450 [Patescibacteria group bacterium]